MSVQQNNGTGAGVILHAEMEEAIVEQCALAPFLMFIKTLKVLRKHMDISSKIPTYQHSIASMDTHHINFTPIYTPISSQNKDESHVVKQNSSIISGMLSHLHIPFFSAFGNSENGAASNSNYAKPPSPPPPPPPPCDPVFSLNQKSLGFDGPNSPVYVEKITLPDKFGNNLSDSSTALAWKISTDLQYHILDSKTLLSLISLSPATLMYFEIYVEPTLTLQVASNGICIHCYVWNPHPSRKEMAALYEDRQPNPHSFVGSSNNTSSVKDFPAKRALDTMDLYITSPSSESISGIPNSHIISSSSKNSGGNTTTTTSSGSSTEIKSQQQQQQHSKQANYSKMTNQERDNYKLIFKDRTRTLTTNMSVFSVSKRFTDDRCVYLASMTENKKGAIHASDLYSSIISVLERHKVRTVNLKQGAMQEFEQNGCIYIVCEPHTTITSTCILDLHRKVFIKEMSTCDVSWRRDYKLSNEGCICLDVTLQKTTSELTKCMLQNIDMTLNMSVKTDISVWERDVRKEKDVDDQIKTEKPTDQLRTLIHTKLSEPENSSHSKKASEGDNNNNNNDDNDNEQEGDGNDDDDDDDEMSNAEENEKDDKTSRSWFSSIFSTSSSSSRKSASIKKGRQDKTRKLKRRLSDDTDADNNNNNNRHKRKKTAHSNDNLQGEQQKQKE